MAIRRFVVSCTNDRGSSLNPAENVWRIDPAGQSDADIAAQLIGFTVRAMNFFASPYRLRSVLSGPDAGPLTLLPFPTTELAAINAAIDAGYTAPTSSYGDAQGNAQESCPPGSSVTITEYTAAGGRHNGRKYLPFLSIIGTDTAGAIDVTAATGVEESYLVWILGTDPAGGPMAGIPSPLNPVIGAGNAPVLSTRVSSAPARLRTRIR